jgi:hypothetical protein
VEALEEAGKGVGALGGDEPVNVVIHDAVAVDEHAFFLGDEGEALEVALHFEACGEQLVAVNSAGDNMMGCTGDDTAGGARHGMLNLLPKKWREREKNLGV